MTATKHLTLDGKTTTPTDPARGIWYGTGVCGYWTDDWTTLVTLGPGIPACPTCKAFGMQMTAGEWEKGVAAARRDGEHHGYTAFVASHNRHCFKAEGGPHAAYEKATTLTSWLPAGA